MVVLLKRNLSSRPFVVFLLLLFLLRLRLLSSGFNCSSTYPPIQNFQLPTSTSFILLSASASSISLGGPTPYTPIDLLDATKSSAAGGMGVGARNPGNNSQQKANQSMPLNVSTDQMQRARVLCSYDAKDHTELNLSANEVSSQSYIMYTSIYIPF